MCVRVSSSRSAIARGSAMQIPGLISAALPHGSVRHHCRRARYYLPGNGQARERVAHARKQHSKNPRARQTHNTGALLKNVLPNTKASLSRNSVLLSPTHINIARVSINIHLFVSAGIVIPNYTVRFRGCSRRIKQGDIFILKSLFFCLSLCNPHCDKARFPLAFFELDLIPNIVYLIIIHNIRAKCA